jgi:hypothetical protein
VLSPQIEIDLVRPIEPVFVSDTLRESSRQAEPERTLRVFTYDPNEVVGGRKSDKGD